MPKVVIYTAIAGGYDELIRHNHVSGNFDYVCFSDREEPHIDGWEIRQMNNTNLDSVRKAKYYKVFPDKIFPDHDYSIWIDANIDVLGPSLENRINELISSDAKLAANPHLERGCIYEEAKECIALDADDTEVIIRQLKYMSGKGFPPNQGQYEMSMIFRKHHDPGVKEIMKDWWRMIRMFSRRDQLSFVFVLYRNKVDFVQHLFPVNPKSGSDFAFRPHNTVLYPKLFYHSGAGFRDNVFLIERCVHNDQRETRVLFTFDGPTDVWFLKFDPISKRAGKINIQSIKVFSQVNGEHTLDLATIIPSARAREGYNPRFIFPLSGESISWVEIIFSGEVFSAYKSNKMLLNKMAEIQMVGSSVAWKIIKSMKYLQKKYWPFGEKKS